MSAYGAWNRFELYAALTAMAVFSVFAAWSTVDPLGYGRFSNSLILLIRGGPPSMITFNAQEIAPWVIAIPIVFVVYLRFWQRLTGR